MFATRHRQRRTLSMCVPHLYGKHHPIPVRQLAAAATAQVKTLVALTSKRYYEANGKALYAIWSG